MPIAEADIAYKLSTKGGAAGNTQASTPAASLGKYISTTEITDAILNNLFDDVSGDENVASDVEYRCFFVHNEHATISWDNVVVWLSSETAGGAAIAISVDTTAASAVGSATAQAKDIADESTAPATQTFSSPTTKGTGLSIGTLAAGQCRAVWVRRTAANTSSLDPDGVVLRCEGDSA